MLGIALSYLWCERARLRWRSPGPASANQLGIVTSQRSFGRGERSNGLYWRAGVARMRRVRNDGGERGDMRFRLRALRRTHQVPLSSARRDEEPRHRNGASLRPASPLAVGDGGGTTISCGNSARSPHILWGAGRTTGRCCSTFGSRNLMDDSFAAT